MKNALMITGVFIGVVLAALLAWAALGGNGGARKAVLEEPTHAGSIGELTIGGLRGASAMPARSFAWHAGWVGGQALNLQYDPLEVLRDGDELSPGIFSLATSGTSAPDASLELRANGAASPYLSYQLTPVHVEEYRGGKLEKIGLDYQAIDVIAGEGNAPEPDPSEVVGHMMLPGVERRLPIFDFDSGFRSVNGAPRLDQAVIRRPLDQVSETLKNDLVAHSILGIVTIELQTPEETEPHVTYQLESNVRLAGISHSAAAGGTPTEELVLGLRRMRVTKGRNTSCYDTSTGNSC